MRRNEVAILIIAHRPELNPYEEISLMQCNKILGKYRTYLIYPQGLNINNYKQIFDQLDPIAIAPEWLSSYNSFNKLKLSPFLYGKFLKYKYVLFYEPDAFVFKDSLQEWIKEKHTYVGAPWFQGFHKSTTDSPLIGVGNGGLSLRKVKVFYMLALLLRFIKPKILSLKLQEDVYWCQIIAPRVPFFKVPSPMSALSFAMENHPKRCFEMNGKVLPFGVHAWYKYDLEFWRPFIEAEGYEIP
jgi:hypothetical protein